MYHFNKILEVERKSLGPLDPRLCFQDAVRQLKESRISVSAMDLAGPSPVRKNCFSDISLYFDHLSISSWISA